MKSSRTVLLKQWALAIACLRLPLCRYRCRSSILRHRRLPAGSAHFFASRASSGIRNLPFSWPREQWLQSWRLWPGKFRVP